MENETCHHKSSGKKRECQLSGQCLPGKKLSFRERSKDFCSGYVGISMSDGNITPVCKFSAPCQVYCSTRCFLQLHISRWHIVSMQQIETSQQVQRKAFLFFTVYCLSAGNSALLSSVMEQSTLSFTKMLTARQMKDVKR